MEINYDLILKYLLPDKVEETLFESKKNIMIFSDTFPHNYKDLLGDKFYRIGVTQNYNNFNISFFSSFLTLLSDNYMALTEDEEMTQINKLINEILEDINNKEVPNSLKDIVKGALKKYVKDKETCIWLLELIVHKFMINLLIFDFKTQSIYTLYPKDVMNPWRPFLLFAKNDFNWEPIRNQEKRFYSYNDTFIKKILSSNEIKYYDGSIIKKDFTLVDNINEIMDEEFHIEKQHEGVVSDSSEESVDLKKTKLTKMTKEELMLYMKSLNLTFNKKSTKKDLIELVLTQ
jgi:hypothetical protein